LLDSAPPELLDLLVQQINRGEDFRREFFEAFPQTVPYREWLLTFMGAVWNGATEAADVGDSDIPGGADTSPG
jgi:hypothetical protein